MVDNGYLFMLNLRRLCVIQTLYILEHEFSEDMLESSVNIFKFIRSLGAMNLP